MRPTKYEMSIRDVHHWVAFRATEEFTSRREASMRQAIVDFETRARGFIDT